MLPPNAPVVWHALSVSRTQREGKNAHRGVVVWLTGLPASGKSSIAHAVAQNLHQAGMQTAVLDGDNIRHGLSADLGFSVADRRENMRRVSEVAKLLLDLGMVVFVALVSPIAMMRDAIRSSFQPDDFIEVYCKCSLAQCKARDPKTLYAQAEKGTILQFTGITSDYEAPPYPTLILDTENESLEKCVQSLTQFLFRRCLENA